MPDFLAAMTDCTPAPRKLPLLYFSAPQQEELARTLCAEHGFPDGGLAPTGLDEAEEPVLILSAAGLSLQTGRECGGMIRADFLAGRTGYRLGTFAHTSQPLLRALGFRAAPFRVLDATAGLGADGILCACAGCTVTLCERAPVMAALLADGLRRAAEDEAMRGMIATRVTLRKHDARELLRAAGADFDAVYLDPMFPPRQKAALVKKEMRLARLIADEGEDAAALLDVARQNARRVVVKRPLKAPPLGGGFSRQHKGRSVRFDIYGV